jgi:hypothetical protein
LKQKTDKIAKNFVSAGVFDSFAKKGDDLASEEKDIDLEIGEEQDEKLKQVRSSGDSNLPKDGWNGDQDEEIEEEDELDEEVDKQEGVLGQP